MLLPWLIILGTAGPYCAVYAAVMILASGVAALLADEMCIRDRWILERK